MGRLFLTIFSIVLIATSSCSVKNYIVKSFAVSHTIHVKGGKVLNQSESKLVCDSTKEEGKNTLGLPTHGISSQLLIPAYLWLVSLITIWGVKDRIVSGIFYYTSFNHSLKTIPIYLRIGKLIFYN